MYHEAGFGKTFDVIVVGFGDASAVAAMAAHDAGAEVLMVEKQRADARRPNSRFSGGLFISPADVDAAEHYMRQLYRINDDLHETDPALIRTWAEETSRNASWLRARPDYTAMRLADLHTDLLDRLRLGGERAVSALARDIEIGRKAVHKASARPSGNVNPG